MVFYVNRISAKMSAAMSVDEESTENINIECRPMTVTDKYLNFMSETWLDAKTELDEATEMTEKEKCELLCKILTVKRSTHHSSCFQVKIHLTCVYFTIIAGKLRRSKDDVQSDT